MRALILADVHSNLDAFQAVIEDAEGRGGFNRVWSAGDVVGYGPDPGACVELMQSFDHVGVAGNHDLASIGKLSVESFNPHAAIANRWTADNLSEEHIAYLGSLPLKVDLDDFTLVHGSPRDPIWEYVVSTGAAVASFLHFDTSWCIVGHSHVPFLCRPAENGAAFLEFPLDTPIFLGTDRLIINPGGAGQPRDGDPRASYAVYDSAVGAVFHHRVEYDVEVTQEKMRARGLPEFLVERLASGR